MKRTCLTCVHERGETSIEWEAECTLHEECMGLEKWRPEDILVVTDERVGPPFRMVVKRCDKCGHQTVARSDDPTFCVHCVGADRGTHWMKETADAHYVLQVWQERSGSR